MRDKIIELLQKFPFLHRAAKFCYWQIKKAEAMFFGIAIYEKYWQRRHLISKGDWSDDGDWVNGYWESRHHPHRKFLIEKLTAQPIESALEIGANCGPNLYLIAKKFPDARLEGIDINEIAVERGKNFLKKEGVDNVILRTASIGALKDYPDKSFDIVFSDAVLIYVGPDKITDTVREILRIARKKIFFLEWHEVSGDDSDGMGIYHFGHWKRDYIKLLANFIDENRVRATKIPDNLWPGKDWSRMGYLIETIIETR